MSTLHRRPVRLCLVLALATMLVAPSFASAAAVSRPDTSASVPPTAGGPDVAHGNGSAGPASVVPSIHVEDAIAHADDAIDFQPGARVTVGFRPRAGDTWQVGGRAPRDLPAGFATGSEMRRAGQGSAWSKGTPPGVRDASLSGLDSPWVDGSTLIRASQTSALLPSASAAAPGAAPVTPTGLRREVFGFLPYWEVNDPALTLDYAVLSTIAYFGVNADGGGNLGKYNSDGSLTTGWAGWTSSKMTSIMTTAHQTGTRVVLTVESFAWTTSGATSQATLLGSSTARANLANQIAAAVRDRGADGVNLDFEPIVSGYSDGFTALVRSVRAALDAVAPGYQLTFDGTGYIGNYPIGDATAPGGADAVFIMGYDYRGSGSTYAGSISPLSGPAYDLEDTVAAYTARIAPSKVILGVPYYGRAWSTSSDAPNATNISGSTYGASVTAIYTTAADLAAQYGRRWDNVEMSPWTAYQKQYCTPTCLTTWRELYYDDAGSLAMRYDLVNRTGLRGAGIWALGYDGTRPELSKTLADKFLTDTTPPLVGIAALPATSRDAGFEVDWRGYDDSTISSYDVQVSVDGAGWGSWLTGVTTTSDIYLGQDGHRYGFRVRGTDSHGNVSAWNDSPSAWYSSLTPPALGAGSFGSVLVDGLNLRSTPTTSAASNGILHAGDALYVIGGPVSADGYAWYQVEGPVHEWAPVDIVQTGSWVAASSSTATYVAPRIPISGTAVVAGIRGYAVGGAWGRTVTPNGDGISDSVPITWTNAVAFDTMTIRVYAAGGSLVDTRQLGALGAGAQTFAWDARVGGVPVPDGTYVVQVAGTSGGVTYSAPSASPVSSAAEIAAFGIAVDHLPVSRLAGADRYATAAAISAATFAPGVPVAYVATGLNFPDALAGAAAAGYANGPLLLTDTTTLPGATATELARLHPARIVVLGGTSVVSDGVKAALGAYTGGGVSRLAGADRYATAAAISAATFAPGVPVAYVATGLNFPDALAGAAAAGYANGPLLLTDTTTLPGATATELARLHPARIVVLGGTSVVSDGVMAAAHLAGG